MTSRSINVAARGLGPRNRSIFTRLPFSLWVGRLVTRLLSLHLCCHGFKVRALDFTRAEESLEARLGIGWLSSDSNFNSLRACAAKIYVILSLSVCLCVYLLLAKKRMVSDTNGRCPLIWSYRLGRIYCKPYLGKSLKTTRITPFYYYYCGQSALFKHIVLYYSLLDTRMAGRKQRV